MRAVDTLRGALFVVGPAALLLGAGCADLPTEEQVDSFAAADSPGNPAAIDVKRSLAVIDLPTLDVTDPSGQRLFSLKRVLTQLVATSGAAQGGGAAELYQRIFDTNNLKSQGFVADGQHCDDQKDASGNPVLNGFPIQCPRQEGALANPSLHDPFCSGPGCDPYSPVAITNRFDLAPADGRTCGQYRIVFGKGTGGQTPVALAGNKAPFDRNLIIFEAVLPNPEPHRGLAGCTRAAKFWADLSGISSPVQRGKALHRFFFEGLPGFAPALHFNHFTGAVHPQTGEQLSGQIRANQFMFSVGQQAWQLREYNVERACSGHNGPCVARVKLVTSKGNPSASLFDDGDTSATALAFRSPAAPGGFLAQVAQLAGDDLTRINMSGLSPQFNGGQSTSSPMFNTPVLNDTSYNILFNPAGPFAASIQARLTGLGSTLTPTEIVRRAQTQSCAGCHELSTTTGPLFGGAPGGNQLGGGLVWPDAATGGPAVGFGRAFAQTSEVNLQPIDPASGVVCDTACTANPGACQCEWAISPALTDVFLPARRAHLAAFLASLPHGQHGPGDGD
jgi:hypothetical protein